MKIGNITITSIETGTAFHPVNGDYMFTLDELQNATIAQSEEKVPITGKQGRKLNSLKRNKAVTVRGTNGFVSTGLMELQTGSTAESKNTTVMWTDYISVNNNSAETSFVAVGTVGNEIENLFVKNNDGTLGKRLTQGSTVEAGVFTYDPTTKELEFFAGDIQNGTEIAVYYTRRINGTVLENFSDNYSTKCKLYLEAFGEDPCANIYRVQFYIPLADFDGNFELAMGEAQTVHAFAAESLAGSCGAAGLYWTYTIFGVEAEDVTS